MHFKTERSLSCNRWSGLKWVPPLDINFHYSTSTEQLSVMIPILKDIYLIPSDDLPLFEKVHPISARIVEKAGFFDAKFGIQRKADWPFHWVGDLAEAVPNGQVFTIIQDAIRHTKAVERAPFLEVSKVGFDKLLQRAPSLRNKDLVHVLSEKRDGFADAKHELQQLMSLYPKVSEAILSEWLERGRLHKEWCYQAGFNRWDFSPDLNSLSLKEIAEKISAAMPHFSVKQSLTWLDVGDRAGGSGGARYR